MAQDVLKGLLPLVLTLGVLVISLVFIANITQEMSDLDFVNSTTIVVNHSITASNTTGNSLYGQTVLAGTVVVENHSVTVASGNYTVQQEPPLITFVANSEFALTGVNVSYSYANTTETVYRGSLQNGTAAMGNIASYAPILAILIVVVVIIGLLVGMFGRRE